MKRSSSTSSRVGRPTVADSSAALVAGASGVVAGAGLKVAAGYSGRRRVRQTGRCGQEGFQFGHEAFRLDRFADVAVEACRQHLLAVARHRQRRHRQDRHPGQRRLELECGQHLEAVHAGQIDVAGNQVGQLAARRRHPARAVGRSERCVAIRAEQERHQFDVGGIVFDDQDTGHVCAPGMRR
jgi:hypothetical protein